MTDFNYWKEKYRATWGQSSQREADIAKYLAHESGATIKLVGLGAGSAEFLTGSATEHGYAKGDADLVVVGTNIYLEVTGPLVQSVNEHQALWIRPDKLENAKESSSSHETWLVHHLPRNNLIRVVPLDAEFWRALEAGDFYIETPRIRGVQERYYAIPAMHSCVKFCSVLIDRLKKI